MSELSLNNFIPGIVKIGAIYPLTGPNAPIGISIKQALTLAEEIINSHYDLQIPLALSTGLPSLGNRKIKLIWADSMGDPVTGREEAKRLIEQEGVVALIGSYQSSVTAMASLMAESKEIPFLNPESSAHILTERGFKWFFRTGPTDITFTQLFFDMFAFLQEQGEEISKIAILSEDSITGVSETELEINFIRCLGYKLSALEMYTNPVTTLKAELLLIRNTCPQVILGGQFLQDAILTIQTMKKMGYYPDGLVVQDAGYVAQGFLEAVGSDANYIISRASWALGLGRVKPLVIKVNNLYRASYGEDMNETNARSFTGLLVLADAINRAGSTDSFAIRDALHHTFISGDKLIMPWAGVRFDRCGQNILASGLLVQILNQIYKIVWPQKLAEAKIVWPALAWKDRGNY